MSLLAIPTVIGNAISALTSHHGHKKGVNGDAANTALGGSNPSAAAGTSAGSNQASGSTQSLFGTLLDSVEQIVGIQAPASGTSAPTSGTSAPHNVAITPASIAAARAPRQV